MFMFVLVYRVCTYVILGILEIILFVFDCVFREGIYTYITGHFVNEPFFYVCVVV